MVYAEVDDLHKGPEKRTDQKVGCPHSSWLLAYSEIGIGVRAKSMKSDLKHLGG